MACAKWVKQWKGPTLQLTFTSRIGYNEYTKNTCAKKCTWNTEEMGVFSTESQVLW